MTAAELEKELKKRGIQPHPKWNKEQVQRRLDDAINGAEAPGSQGAIWPETHLPEQPEDY